MKNHFLLLYHVENLNAATALGNTVQQAGGKIEYFGLSPDTLGKDTYSQIGGRSEKVILLISDNFLKSEAGMDQALSAIQDLYRNNRLLPVITDGVYYNERTGSVSNITTSFERVSHVIQYMNYWQDKYLELRKTKKEGLASEEDSHSDQIRSVRTISTEIGELLRFLRSIDCYHYDDLAAHAFGPLLALLELQGTPIDPVPHANEAAREEVAAVPPLSAPDEAPTAEVNTLAEEQTPDAAFAEAESEIPVVHTVAEVPMQVIQNELIEESGKTTRNIHQAYIETLVEEAEQMEKERPSGFRSHLNEIVDEIVAEETGKTERDEMATEVTENDPDLALLFQDTSEQPARQLTMSDVFFIPPAAHPQSGSGENLPDEPASDMAFHSLPEGDPEWDAAVDDQEEMLEEIAEPDAWNEDEIKKQVSYFLDESPEQEAPLAPAETVTPPAETEIPTGVTEISSEETEIPPAETEIPTGVDTIAHDRLQEESSEVEDTPMEDLEPVEQMAAALESYATGDTAAGRKAFEAILAAYPAHTGVRLAFARCLAYQEHQTDDAIAAIDQVLAQHPDQTEALVMRGEMAERKKEYLQAQHFYLQAAEVDPELPGIFFTLGNLFNRHFRGQRKKAAKYFKWALEKDPTHTEAAYQYAQILLEHFGKAKKAARYYLDIVRREPTHYRAWMALAEIHYEEGDQAIAHDCYFKAVALDPSLQSEYLDQKYAYAAPEEISEPEAEPVVETPVFPADNGITVMITGATSGIGRATAELLASKGYGLILTGRRSDRLDEIKETLGDKYRSRLHCLTFDVRDQKATLSALESLGEVIDSVDILINNAGLAMGFDPIHEGHTDDWDTMIDTNIRGLLYMTRAIAPGMVARKKGHIINIGSAAGMDAYPNGNVYCATKAAVDMLTKAIRIDLLPHHIRVGQVSPGHVEETEFAKVRFHGDEDKARIYGDFQPLKAQDIAEAIWFMISRPDYVNINDIALSGTQQANTIFIERSGRPGPETTPEKD